MKRVRIIKRSTLILLVFVLLMGCFGCVEPSADPTPSSTSSQIDIKQEYKNDPTKFVVFHRSTEPLETIVSIEELMKYETKFPECNGDWYGSRLSGEDKCIYNSYFYALENCHIGFELYVEDKTKDFYDIRVAFSLDTPFMDQNFNDYGEFMYPMPQNHHGDRMYFRVEQFTDSRWEMKMEALEECRRIVREIPEEYSTTEQKMSYLYQYVFENVEYVEYEEMKDENYFYDAVMNNKTICDGYSNMLSLLFGLIGVECTEVMGVVDEEANEGHTWVAAKLGDNYYNFDPTFENSLYVNWLDDEPQRARLYFGYSDAMNSVTEYELEDLRPKCTDTSRDFMALDVSVNDITSSADAVAVGNAINKNIKNGSLKTLVLYDGILSGKNCERLARVGTNRATSMEDIKYAYIYVGEKTVVYIVGKRIKW